MQHSVPGTNKRAVKLPLSEAFHISLEQIRRRLKRSSLMIAATTLSIAFMVYFPISSLIIESHGKQMGAIVETYQVWLVATSFVVSMVGLMNSTLMAVFERYREIGTMKFLGALDQHILKLFIAESTIIGFFGGLLGFAVGSVAATAAASAQVGLSALTAAPILDILFYMSLSVGLATVLSVVATIYPAYKAARLRPAEALSYDV